MPPKPGASSASEAEFLYRCFENSDHKSVDYKLVAADHGLTVGAASKRFSRLKAKPETASSAFMYSCLKHSGYQKIDYNTLATALNTTSGAVNKRFSRLKAKLEAVAEDQINQDGKATTVADPGPKTPNKRKRTVTLKEEDNDDPNSFPVDADNEVSEEAAPGPKRKKSRSQKTSKTISELATEGAVEPVPSKSAGKKESKSKAYSSDGGKYVPASNSNLPSLPQTPSSARRSEYQELLDVFQATSRPGSISPGFRSN